MNMKYIIGLLLFLCSGTFISCQDTARDTSSVVKDTLAVEKDTLAVEKDSIVAFEKDTFYVNLVNAALERTTKNITYDPSYYRLDYPGGDVPPDKGVCTDVVVRSYRKVGIDLQVEVHEDKKKAHREYPKKWRGRKADKNIDHRRVLNLMVYFKRQGAELPISSNPEDYQPGDLVCWNLGGSITHIGIVVDKKSYDGKRYKIVHNIGAGPQLEDVLFDWKIIGHYRYKK